MQTHVLGFLKARRGRQEQMTNFSKPITPKHEDGRIQQPLEQAGLGSLPENIKQKKAQAEFSTKFRLFHEGKTLKNLLPSLHLLPPAVVFVFPATFFWTRSFPSTTPISPLTMSVSSVLNSKKGQGMRGQLNLWARFFFPFFLLLSPFSFFPPHR